MPLKAKPTSPPASSTLSDNLRSKLIAAIVEGELLPGSKVNEVALAQHYGVSRGPLREALRDLEGLRLLERRPHAGARVVSLGREEIDEIYTIREALEGMAARLAATAMQDNEIKELREVLQLHEAKVSETEGQSYFRQQGDLDFHLKILAGCRNRQLYRLLGEELYQLIMMYRRRSSERSSRPARALEEHKRIFDAIESRDPELAEILMRRHIQGARRSLQTWMEQNS